MPSQAITDGAAAEPAVTRRPRATTPEGVGDRHGGGQGEDVAHPGPPSAGRGRRGHQGLAVARRERVHRAEERRR